MTDIPLYIKCHCVSEDVTPVSLSQTDIRDIDYEDFIDIVESESMFLCRSCGLFCNNMEKHMAM